MHPERPDTPRTPIAVWICFLIIACCLPARGAAGWVRVEADRYSVDSLFWWPRIRHIVVSYVPFTMDMIENDRSDWKIFARYRAVADRRAGKDVPNPCVHNWAEATLLNTFESMCWALAVDPRGDPEVIAAQHDIRAGVERWVPVILAAQEPDGYLCTDAQMRGFPRFVSPSGKLTPGEKADPRVPAEDMHEGYMLGYFLDCAIAHYRATGRKDLRLYHAAKKSADLFCDSIGDAPKTPWQPDHAGLEQSLARFALLVDEVEEKGGEKYVRLAKWLLENRGVTPPRTDSYRQKDKPLAQQGEPYGHAVMFGYLYSGAADVARLTGDPVLKTASGRLWESLVNSKMYLTGTMGSRNEEFGKKYELPNDSLLGETCAAIANLHFQQNMNLLDREAKYGDVAETILYNGLLGSVALDKPEWQYFNQLDQSKTGKPVGRQMLKPDCCMGNISRTLLRLPTWIYSKSTDGIAVNQFIGGTVLLRGVAGTDVTVVQKTNYPWDERVSVLLHISSPRRFAVRIRVPSGQSSLLYVGAPNVRGLEEVAVNGSAVQTVLRDGYVVLEREWSDGDRIDFRVPLAVQRVHADERVAADRGRVALQYGPLVYNFESVDLPPGKSLDQVELAKDAPLSIEWDASLLGGLKTIRGAFVDGTPLRAVPHYARMNRGSNSPGNGERSIVWVREASPRTATVKQPGGSR